MKIRDVDTFNNGKKIQEAPKEIPKHLFDQGLLQGIEIDPADQPKERKNRFLDVSVATQSALSKKIPDAKLTNTSVDGWVRQDTPSLGVPYGIANLWVRPLTVSMLAKVHHAQLIGEKDDPAAKQAGYTMLVDALGPTIQDFDIRDLTVPDFNSHIYWLRLNSYPKSPFTIPWTSRYGNENMSRVTASNFNFQELEMSREEFLEWNAKGITFPTVRDMELLLDPDLDAETNWTMTYAQYIYLDEEPSVDSMRRKIQLLEEGGPDLIGLIKEFALKATHGVEEQLSLRDEKFELNAAIEFLQNQLNALTEILESEAASKTEDEMGELSRMISLTNYMQGLASELEVLRKVKINNGLDANGRPFKPEMEVVALASANATFLFP